VLQSNRVFREDIQDATHSTDGRCDTTCFGCLPAGGVLTSLTSLKNALPREKKHIPLTLTLTIENMPGMTIRVGGRDGGEGKTKGCYSFVTTANGYVYRDVM